MNKNIVWAFAGGPAVPQEIMRRADIVLINHGALTEIVKSRFGTNGWMQTADAEAYLYQPGNFQTHTIFLAKGLTPR